MGTFEIVRGLGDFGAQITADGVLSALPLPAFSFVAAIEASTETAQAYKAGRRQDKKVIDTGSTYTLTLTTQVPTWQTLAAARGQKERAIDANTDVMRTKFFTIAADGTVPVPGLLAANIATTAVAIEEDGGQDMTNVAAAPAGPTEVQVSDNQLTFDVSKAGDTAFVTWFVQPTGGQIVGGPGTLNKISQFNFAGEIYDSTAGGGNGIFGAPNCELSAQPNISFEGGLFTLEMVYTMLSFSNWDEPYLIGRNMVFPV